MSREHKNRQAQLRRLRLTRARQKLWREQPERMEAIRVRATATAKAVSEGKHRHFVSHLQTLPREFTLEWLNMAMLDDWCAVRKVSRRAFFIRVKRHGLMVYDSTRGLWVNLTVPE